MVKLTCFQLGILFHEIGHALGFRHEQSRFDRDSFVKVYRENIQSDKKGNFDKETETSLNTYDIPYEYGSIMHYGANAFAINQNNPVLIAKNQLFQQTMGQRILPSFFDVYQANRYYNCFGRCIRYLFQSISIKVILFHVIDIVTNVQNFHFMFQNF